MFRFLALFGIFYFSVAALATPSSDTCFNKVTPLKKWETLSTEQSKCMKSNNYFIEGLSILCTKNGKDLSNSFVKYQSFEKQYSAAQVQFKSSNDVNIQQEAMEDMLLVERDWSLFGSRDQVDAVMDILDVTRYNCTRK